MEKLETPTVRALLLGSLVKAVCSWGQIYSRPMQGVERLTFPCVRQGNSPVKLDQLAVGRLGEKLASVLEGHGPVDEIELQVHVSNAPTPILVTRGGHTSR